MNGTSLVPVSHGNPVRVAFEDPRTGVPILRQSHPAANLERARGHQFDAELGGIRAGVRERRQHELRRRCRERPLLEVHAVLDARLRADRELHGERDVLGGDRHLGERRDRRERGLDRPSRSLHDLGRVAAPGDASTLAKKDDGPKRPSRFTGREGASRDDDRVAAVLAQVDAREQQRRVVEAAVGRCVAAQQDAVRNPLAECGARGFDVDQRDRREGILRRGFVGGHCRGIERMREAEHDVRHAAPAVDAAGLREQRFEGLRLERLREGRHGEVESDTARLRGVGDRVVVVGEGRERERVAAVVERNGGRAGRVGCDLEGALRDGAVLAAPDHATTRAGRKLGRRVQDQRAVGECVGAARDARAVALEREAEAVERAVAERCRQAKTQPRRAGHVAAAGRRFRRRAVRAPARAHGSPRPR